MIRKYACYILLIYSLSLFTGTPCHGAPPDLELQVTFNQNINTEPQLNPSAREKYHSSPVPVTLDNKKKSSTLSTILLYVPNRIFDLLDIFRIRVRIGPGIGAGIRITEPLSIFAGSHAAIYAGLPGPRQTPEVPLPIGAEAVAGGRLSLLDGVYASDTSSRHSQTEIGIETQLLLVGIDIGIDPLEILDFLTGFFLIQIRDDDL
jgi:hypothetical protein